MQKPIQWFEIPVANLPRARAFYEAVFDCALQDSNCGGMQMALFPYAENATGGALCHHPQLKPSLDGTVIYLDGGDDLNAPLQRAQGQGAEVMLPKTDLGNGIGHIALFQDCEGNRIGLYSPN